MTFKFQNSKRKWFIVRFSFFILKKELLNSSPGISLVENGICKAFSLFCVFFFLFSRENRSRSTAFSLITLKIRSVYLFFLFQRYGKWWRDPESAWDRRRSISSSGRRAWTWFTNPTGPASTIGWRRSEKEREKPSG